MWMRRTTLPLLAVALAACAASPTDLVDEDRVEPVPRPAVVRGLYVNAQAAGLATHLQGLLDIADSSLVNTFVIDVKERGEVSYESDVPLVASIGALRGDITDLPGVLTALRDHGIYPIARIVVFRDPVLAEARPEWAIHTVDDGVWLDSENSRPWVDPFNPDVWAYNIALAAEALGAGFAEIQWDYVRFPDVSDSVRATMVFPAQAGRTFAEGIQAFISASRVELAAFDAPITADVFGRVITTPDDSNIGQFWDELVHVTDVILPMVYPALYWPNSFGIPDPNAEPYQTVRHALDSAVVRTAALPTARASVRPWLQAFTQGSTTYGAPEMLAQRQAAADAGLEEWLFWNPNSTYPLAGVR
jgi:hypothetical protein